MAHTVIITILNPQGESRKVRYEGRGDDFSWYDARKLIAEHYPNHQIAKMEIEGSIKPKRPINEVGDKVLIFIDGGIVVDVKTTDKRDEVLVHDWDNYNNAIDEEQASMDATLNDFTRGREWTTHY